MEASIVHNLPHCMSKKAMIIAKVGDREWVISVPYSGDVAWYQSLIDCPESSDQLRDRKEFPLPKDLTQRIKASIKKNEIYFNQVATRLLQQLVENHRRKQGSM